MTQAITIVPGSSFPLTNRPQDNMRFLGVDTNGQTSSDPNTRSNFSMTYGQMRTNFVVEATTNAGVASTNYANGVSNSLATTFAFGTGGFITLITNGASTATIQGIFNSLTNGGVISVQPGSYTITSPLANTNNKVILQGNGATWVFAASKTNAMLNSTNPGNSFLVDNLIFDGAIRSSFNDTAHFHLENGSDEPYYNASWTNRTGLRVETSGGVRVQNCIFTGWPGNGCLAYSIGGTLGAQNTSKFEFLFNRCYQNFIGVIATGVQYETPGYYNSDVSQWLDASAEYCLIEGNDCTSNQVGIAATAGNHLIQGNTINANYVGVGGYSGPNCLHGRLCGNTINHNTHAFILEGCTSGELIYNNYMLANGDVVANGVGQLQFSYNSLGKTYIIITNGGVGAVSSGLISFNMFDATAVWGSSNATFGIWTNIAPTMIVQGNYSADGTNTDGSTISTMMHFNGAATPSNMPPVAADYKGQMFYWNSNGSDIYLLKSSSSSTAWSSTNHIN